MKRFLFLCALLTGALACAEDPLVVHEWGTFTSLQDEEGNAIGGINTDDEPLPDFVHRIASGLLLSPTEAPPVFFQGAPRCHPDVTMRLETPVLYFHPPAGWKSQPVDVHIAFRGGWLTEYYPFAAFKAPGLKNEDSPVPKAAPVAMDAWRRRHGWQIGHIKKDTLGELWWKGLAINAKGEGPETKERVWLSPREVDAALVESGSGEREKFLFYRGVANRDASLRVVRREASGTLEIREGPRDGYLRNADVHAAWLVEVEPGGACAFRSLGTLKYGAPVGASVPESFAAADFLPANLSDLRSQMRKALIGEGLFADEAEALLNTWRVSYFTSPGLRLFYICPRVEVDAALPVVVSAPSRITRVMMGRIEIVTREQRALLAKIAAGPVPDLSLMRGVTGGSNSDFFNRPENLAHWNAVIAGKGPYSLLGLPVPELYQDYLKLGRFRNALILDEEKRRPTAALKEFISRNEFGAYVID